MSTPSGNSPAAPRDAATVLLLRESADASEPGFEVFMVRRHGRSGFMGGAYVFPGGKLDEADSDARVLDRVRGRTPQDCAAALGEDDPRRSAGLFVAAVRETFEEAGVLLADRSEHADLGAARRALHEGKGFADVLERLDAALRLDWLVPCSRWVTPEIEPKRYDTRFLLAHAPAGQAAAHDRLETTAGEWIRPARALERGREGEIQLPPPTLRTLELLAAHRSVADAVADAASGPPPLVRPVVRDLDGTLAICLPGDPEHPERRAAIGGPTRIVLEHDRWRSREPSR